jgi:hypothetical protein
MMDEEMVGYFFAVFNLLLRKGVAPDEALCRAARDYAIVLLGDAVTKGAE